MSTEQTQAAATHRLMEAVAALHTIGLDISTQTDMPTVLRGILRRAMELLDVDAGGSIYLYDPARGSLVLTAALGGIQQLGTSMHPGEGLAGKVFTSGEPLTVDDYNTWADRAARFEPVEYHAVMSVPLRWHEEVIGTVNFASNQAERRFTAEDIQLAELFASQAAIAIGNVRLFDSAQRRIDQLDSLRTILLELLTAKDVNHILYLIAWAALEHTHAQDVHLYLYDQSKDKLTFGTSLWSDGTINKEVSSPRPDGITMTVARTGKRVLVVDPRHDPMFAESGEEWDAVTAFVSVPFRRGDEVLGVFNISFDKQTILDKGLLNYLDLLAAQAAVALYHAQLFQAAERRAEEADRLRKVALEILSTNDVGVILRRITQEAVEHGGAQDVRIYLYDAANDKLTFGSSILWGSEEAHPPRSDGLTATVARTGERIFVNEGERDPLFANWTDKADEWHFEAMVGVPLKRGSEVIGVLNGIFPHAISEDVLRFLDLLAAQAAVAIQNARLFEATQRRAEEYGRLRNAALELLSTNDVTAMMRAIAHAAVVGVQAQDVHIYTYDADADTLTLGTSLWGPTGEYDRPIISPRADGLTATVARSGVRMMIADPATHPLFADLMASSSWRFHTIIGVPLKQGERVIGVMNVLFEEKADEDVLNYLDLLAAQAVVGFQSARLYTAERSARSRADAVLNAALTLSSTLSLSDLLKQILEECAKVLPFVTGSIMIYEEEIPSVVALAGYEGNESMIVDLVHNEMRHSPLHQRLLTERTPIIIPNIATHPDWVQFEEITHIKSWMGVPLISRGEVIGALSLDSDELSAYTPEHAEMAQALAAHASIAIENARLFNSTQEALAQIEAFFSASQKLVTARDPDDLLRAIASSALARATCNALLAYVDLDQEGCPEWVEIVACTTQPEGPTLPEPGTRIRLSDLPVGRYIRQNPGRVLVVPELDPKKTHNRLTQNLLEAAGSRATVFIPLMLGERLVGLINLHWNHPYQLTPQEVQFYIVLSPQMAAIVENRRLFEQTEYAQERFRDIALATSDWVWETDSRGRVIYCTEQILESLGYGAQEYIGHTFYEFMVIEEAGRVRRMINDHAARRASIEGLEYWVVHRDGHRVDLSTSAVPILDSRRGVIGFRGVTKDITEQRRAEQRERLAYEIGQRMTGVLSFEELTAAVVDQLQNLFGYYHAFLFLFDEESSLMRVQEGAGVAQLPFDEEPRPIDIREWPSLIAMAGRNREPVISNDTSGDPNHLALEVLRDTRSEACFPLIHSDRLLGVLDIQSDQPARFTPAEVRALQNLAAHVAIAIENARLYEAERAARARADALLEASRVLSSTLSLEELLQSILKQCAVVVPYSVSSITIYENSRPVLAATAGESSLAEHEQQKLSTIFEASPILSRLIEARRPVIVPDIPNDPEWIPFPGEESLRSWMGVPMLARDSLIGILMLYSDQLNAYSKEHLDFAQGLAAHAALAIENARLYRALEKQASHLEDLVEERTAEVVRQQERLKAIVEGAGEAIIFTGVSGRIEFTNPAWERLTGHAFDAIKGKRANVLLGQNREVYRGILATIIAGSVWEGELHARRPDGSEYDVAVTAAPVHDAAGRLVNVVGILRDVSALKEVERMRGKFVTNISHELRTPITSLKLFYSLLRAGPNERRDEYLDTMSGELSRLERLIEDLLDISRLDQGVLSMRPQALDLNQVVFEVQRAHLLRAEERGLKLETDLYDGLPPIHGDRERLMQVLVNLLTNAINYTNPGDQIGVRTWLASENETPIAALTVWDSGIGIAPEDLPFIFNRFFRAETAKVEGVPGTGLGLSIVKEIVEMHGGRITVESAPSQGTTFTIYLPISQLGEPQGEAIFEPRNPL